MEQNAISEGKLTVYKHEEDTLHFVDVQDDAAQCVCEHESKYGDLVSPSPLWDRPRFYSDDYTVQVVREIDRSRFALLGYDSAKPRLFFWHISLSLGALSIAVPNAIYIQQFRPRKLLSL